VSVSIYLLKFEDLSWGREFAEWLQDKVSRSEGDILNISNGDFKKALKMAPKKFKKDWKDNIASVQKALDECRYDSIDISISW
jgi:hypothetical protein